MSKITRTEPGALYAKSVEYHNFVYLPGLTATDTSKDIAGQTAEILAAIDAALEANGTDNTRLLTAQIWLKDIKDRDAMNKVWAAWLPKDEAPVRVCVQAALADPAQLIEIQVMACK